MGTRAASSCPSHCPTVAPSLRTRRAAAGRPLRFTNRNENLINAQFSIPNSHPREQHSSQFSPNENWELRIDRILAFCMSCPKCNSNHIHPSEIEGLEWVWLVLTFKRPLRCQICRERFWEYFWKR